MRFSILTPSFNQAAFIEKNILSVQQQDVSEVEHIICDGGSTDGTVDILRRHSGRLGYWCSEKDAGQADALQKGLDHATGDIIGWLNTDEYYDPNVFGEVQRAFERDPGIVLVYGDFRRVKPDGGAIRVNRAWRFDYDVCRIRTPIVMNCSAFFRRDRLVSCGGFDRSYQFIMDWELYVRLMRDGQKWHRLKRVIGNFTMHPAAKTAKAQDVFRAELSRLRKREFPGWTEAQVEQEARRQDRRMRWHMVADGVIFEKVWFKVFRQRYYAEYFGSGSVHVPVLTPMLDGLFPVPRSVAGEAARTTTAEHEA